MTSISGVGWSSRHALPLQSLQQQLTKNVSAGKVNSSDQSALSSALDEIDASLQGSIQSVGGTEGKPSKATIDDLIAKEVSSGKLTSDQASQLQGVFGSFARDENTLSNGTGLSFSDLLSTNNDSSNTSTSSTSSDLSDILKDFLKSLQNSSVSGYSAAGTTSTSVTALLVDIKS